MIKYILTVILFFANAQVQSAPKMSIVDFWVVSPPPVASFTAAYGTIKNTGDEFDTLLSVSNNQGPIMLHKTEVTSGRAQMVHLDNIIVKPNESLVLKPMSYHLMIKNQKKQGIATQQSMTLHFKFKKSGTISIKAPIRFPY